MQFIKEHLPIIVAIGIIIGVIFWHINELAHQQNKQYNDLKENIEQIQQKNQKLKEHIEQQSNRLEQQRQDLKELKEISQELKEIYDQLEIFTAEITGYAPHDPTAEEGHCYEGSPEVTATGTYPVVGEVAAVDPEVIPYGSKIYIEGKGLYRAEDTGSAIQGKIIDVVMENRQQTSRFGRQERKVLIFRN